MLRERAAQADAAKRHFEALSAEVAALQERLEGLQGQDARVAELQQEVGVSREAFCAVVQKMDHTLGTLEHYTIAYKFIC